MEDTVLYDSLTRALDEALDEFKTKEDDNMGTVYLAGDILTEGAKMRRAWEADQLRSIGANLHVPHEDKSINDKANAVQDGLAERIVANDTQGIVDSDVIVIDAHENGKGTLVELGQIKGMKDMALMVIDAIESLYYPNDGESAVQTVEEIKTLVSDVMSKKVYAHNTDIRRANSDPQAGDRREYAPNQYVYGTVLDLTDGHGFYNFDEIVEELKEDE